MAEKVIPKCESITQEQLRYVLTYDPLTGFFTRNFSSGKWPKGHVLGSIGREGYVQLYFDGIYVAAHRLAWFWMMGEWPNDQIDHEDLNKSNNVWANLRPSTQLENMQNMPLRKDSTTGLMGVSFDKRSGKFRAIIQVHKKQKWLGYFDDALDAHEAYAEAKARLHWFQPTIPENA